MRTAVCAVRVRLFVCDEPRGTVFYVFLFVDVENSLRKHDRKQVETLFETAAMIIIPTTVHQ